MNEVRGYVVIDLDRLLCRRCGAIVFNMLDLGDDARTARVAHDEHHALIDELRAALQRRNEEHAERMERTDG